MTTFTIYGKNQGEFQANINQICSNYNSICYGYVRQSTTKQKSIDEQIHEITKKAFADNFQYVIIFKVKCSAWDPIKINNNIEFKNMLKLIKKLSEYKYEQYVYIYDVSRFMRNVLMAAKFINEIFDPYNCKIVSLIDNKVWDKDNTNRNDFMQELVNAESSSTLLSKKIKNNVKLRKEAGHHIGGIKYGYESYRRKGIRKLRQNNYEQKILGYIKLKKSQCKEKYYSKKYLGTIAKALNYKRIYKRNAMWTPSMIRTIMTGNLSNVKAYEFKDDDNLDNWLQCESCRKWRKVNEKYYKKYYSKKFNCEYIPCLNCNIPEEKYSSESEENDMETNTDSDEHLSDNSDMETNTNSAKYLSDNSEMETDISIDEEVDNICNKANNILTL